MVFQYFLLFNHLTALDNVMIGLTKVKRLPREQARAKAAAAQTYDPIGSYLSVAVVYLAIVVVFDELLKLLERRTRIPGLELEGKKA
jgi:ABC-type amino acid transport system permease subunit